MSRTRKPPAYNATEMGDTAFSAPLYACKHCGKERLSWGVHGPHRRLFEAPGVLHDCLNRKEQRCACEGFGDFTIPIEHYNDHRFERRA